MEGTVYTVVFGFIAGVLLAGVFNGLSHVLGYGGLPTDKIGGIILLSTCAAPILALLFLALEETSSRR